MKNPSPDDLQKFGKYFAVETNNLFWTLSETDVDTDGKQKLLELAFTSLHHWQAVGTERNITLAKLNVARALCINQVAELGLAYAQLCFDYFKGGEEQWVIPFTEIILSHACLNMGDHTGHQTLYNQAMATAANLDAEDRSVFDATAQMIPAP